MKKYLVILLSLIACSFVYAQLATDTKSLRGSPIVFADSLNPIRKLSTSFTTNDYIITSDDFGKVITSSSSTNVSFTLPQLTTNDIGTIISFSKTGSGKVTIQTPSADVFITTGTNLVSTTPFSYVSLLLSQTNLWIITSINGTWAPQ